MTRSIVATKNAPKAIGPYSQAVIAMPGRMIFCSGQLPIDPLTGQFDGAGDIRQETHQALKNLQAVLEASHASFADVTKTTIFLTNLGHFATVNEIYANYFPHDPPARSTVQVAALPRGAQIEIEAIAVVP